MLVLTLCHHPEASWDTRAKDMELIYLAALSQTRRATGPFALSVHLLPSPLTCKNSRVNTHQTMSWMQTLTPSAIQLGALSTGDYQPPPQSLVQFPDCTWKCMKQAIYVAGCVAGSYECQCTAADDVRNELIACEEDSLACSQAEIDR